MENINKIIINIKELFNLKDDKEVCDLLGITSSNFSKMKTRNKIPYDNLFELSEKKDIDINSIIYGKIDKKSTINFEEELHKMIKKLDNQKKEIYYHLVKAELLKEDL